MFVDSLFSSEDKWAGVQAAQDIVNAWRTSGLQLSGREIRFVFGAGSLNWARFHRKGVLHTIQRWLLSEQLDPDLVVVEVVYKQPHQPGGREMLL